MQHNLEMHVVQLIDDLLRIRKDIPIEIERAVGSVPPGGTESGPEVYDRITGKSLFSKRLSDGKDFLTTGERSMRLLISQTPKRRHLRVASQSRILRHD